jgi:hypothetical protein
MECLCFPTFGVGGCHCPSLSSPVLEFPVSALEWMGEPHRPKVTFAAASFSEISSLSLFYAWLVSRFTVLSWKSDAYLFCCKKAFG